MVCGKGLLQPDSKCSELSIHQLPKIGRHRFELLVKEVLLHLHMLAWRYKGHQLCGVKIGTCVHHVILCGRR